MSPVPAGQVGVDPQTAREVAAAFLEAPNAPRNPRVIAAYAELTAQTERLFARLTDPDGSYRIRVAMTSEAYPYCSDAQLIEAVRSERVLEVTTVAADPDRPHPLLGCEPGGAYDRFRAVHDLLGHVGPGLGFDRDGEFVAWKRQDRLHQGLARWALATELHAEHSVLWTTGALAEHKAILIDRRLLARAKSAGSARRAVPAGKRA